MLFVYLSEIGKTAKTARWSFTKNGLHQRSSTEKFLKLGAVTLLKIARFTSESSAVVDSNLPENGLANRCFNRNI